MPQNKNKPSAVSVKLLSERRSTRLKNISKKRSEAKKHFSFQHTNNLSTNSILNKTVKDELLCARNNIDHKLGDILNKFPVNKQSKFFSIRFGMSIEQLKELPIKNSYSVLRINNKISTIANFNYFGQFISKKSKT